MAGELNIFSNPVYDFEFLGFTFDGRHSSEFGLTVVSPGGLYQENMFASFEDKTIQVFNVDKNGVKEIIQTQTIKPNTSNNEQQYNFNRFDIFIGTDWKYFHNRKIKRTKRINRNRKR